MTGFNYRFSIIPAGAITDARLSPRALQLLCLLGRHINNDGWCSRSQVKMARELKWGRSTIYDALEELYAAAWVERRRNGRGSTAPEASDQPFAAYSYRVVIDREKQPAADVEEGADGAAPAAGGAAIAAGGAAPVAAPLEDSPCEGILAEPSERERTRAGEGSKQLSALKTKWPTSAIDDQDAIQREWAALPDSERVPCVERVDDWLETHKRQKRSAVPALARYIAQRLWKLLPPAESKASAAAPIFLRKGSAEFRALATAHAIAATELRIEVDRKGEQGVWFSGDVPAGAEALAAYAGEDGTVDRSSWIFLHVRDNRLGHQDAYLLEVERDKQRVAAWRDRVREWRRAVPAGQFIAQPDGKYAMGLLVPSEWPPPKGQSEAA